VILNGISVQNEPDYGKEWTWWTPQEMLRFMKENAGVINCKVIAPESFSYNKSMSDPILNDPKALANMDILGAHTYGTQVKDFPYPLFKQKGAGKDLWMTEVYVPNSDNNSADRWPEALDVAQHIDNAMVEGEFQMYTWWYIRRQYGPMKEDGTISKRGYMMAHFSKFVRPGYVRVEATKNPAPNVYVSAYKKDKAVIIAINKGTSQVNQSFSIQNGSASKVTPYVTTGTRNLAKAADINVANGSFTASLPAQSVTTFVTDLSNATTTTPTNNDTVVECENMNLSGSYAGKITSPFSGVRLYSNNDSCAYTQYFANDKHSFALKGCSSSSNTAKVDLQIGGKTVGSFNFTGTTPAVQTISNVSHGTGNQEVKLVVTTDNGTWDANIDSLKIN
jgi:glucuronoarabinoxylan endo-1,4-beta-xylanase